MGLLKGTSFDDVTRLLSLFLFVVWSEEGQGDLQLLLPDQFKHLVC